MTAINEQDFTIDISSPSFMADKIIKKITHVPSGLTYTAIGTIAECNKEIRVWMETLETRDGEDNG